MTDFLLLTMPKTSVPAKKLGRSSGWNSRQCTWPITLQPRSRWDQLFSAQPEYLWRLRTTIAQKASGGQSRAPLPAWLGTCRARRGGGAAPRGWGRARFQFFCFCFLFFFFCFFPFLYGWFTFIFFSGSVGLLFIPVSLLFFSRFF